MRGGGDGREGANEEPESKKRRRVEEWKRVRVECTREM
jgi:hypothetical protein